MGFICGQAQQLHRAEGIPSPWAWWGLPTPVLVVVLLMQHKLGGLIISIEVNYISHYSKSPVHAMLSTSFNSLPPVTVDFCTELLLYIPCLFQARSSMSALLLPLLFFLSVFLVPVTKEFGGSRWGSRWDMLCPRGRGWVEQGWGCHLQGQAVSPTLCVPWAGAEQG